MDYEALSEDGSITTSESISDSSSEEESVDYEIGQVDIMEKKATSEDTAMEGEEVVVLDKELFNEAIQSLEPAVERAAKQRREKGQESN